MEEEFYKDEFEQFLQQQANSHRMYPTDGVWQGIYKKLHGDKKWPALTFAAFTFLTAVIGISVYFAPKPNIFAPLPLKSTTSQAKLSENSSPLISSLSNTDKVITSKDFISQQQNNLGIGKDGVNVANVNLPVAQNAGSSTNIPVRFIRTVVPVTADERIKTVESTVATQLTQSTSDANYLLSSTTEYKKIINVAASTLLAIPPSVKSSGVTKAEKDKDDKNMADDFLKQHNNDIALFTTTRKISRKKKFSYAVYIAPSISYRRLKEEQIIDKTNTLNGPVALNYVTDVNKVVRHKPGTGIETGLAFTYHITNSLGIRGGIQFNIRQYNIEAYKSSGEMATIALLGRSNGMDSINTFAVYRNNNGYLSAELVNRYYQVSLPVGIDWEVIGNKRLKFNVAANIQPTYTMNRNSFLLSTDFKNYTQNVGMLRNWNINTNVEAYMSIKVGSYSWQVGPQLRYQQLPTFMSEYPIREHLMDYGFKLGVSKLIK